MSERDPERNERMAAVAQQIIKALGTSKNPTEDMIKFLSRLDINQLSSPTISESFQAKLDVNEVEEKLNLLEEEVASWESSPMEWGGDSGGAAEYLKDVDEAQRLADKLGSLFLGDGDLKESELHNKAHNIIQMAMARLEEEFTNMLVENKQLFEPEHLSFRSIGDDLFYDESFSSAEYEPLEDSGNRLQTNGGNLNDDYVIDLIDPDCVPDLKKIAKTMCHSKYDQECVHAYVSVRKEALDECLTVLEVEKVSIEGIVKMDWVDLNYLIKKWNRDAKIFVRVYLASEKRLCNLIFGEMGAAEQKCFIDTSKGSMLQLLNFAEAVAMGPYSPERIFRVLDMYEVVAGLIPDIDSLFLKEAGSSVRMEFRDVIKRLGEYVIGILTEFENAVRKNTSTVPFAGGGIHHLTKYVMNYMKALTEYNDTLNLILRDGCEKYPTSLPSSMPDNTHEDQGEDGSAHIVTPLSNRFSSVTSILESNLDGRSKLYKDEALQHFFLMNNIYYMVQKIKSSGLARLFGEGWIKRHNRRFQQHARNYERASWSRILSYLMDDRSSNAGSPSAVKAVVKEKFRLFNMAFEEVYKTQTSWLIPDSQLRDDLRISISLKVLQAYRMFMGRHAHQLDGGRHGDRYIKYSEEDLQNYLLDFFEGSQKSLQSTRRRLYDLIPRL